MTAGQLIELLGYADADCEVYVIDQADKLYPLRRNRPVTIERCGDGRKCVVLNIAIFETFKRRK